MAGVKGKPPAQIVAEATDDLIQEVLFVDRETMKRRIEENSLPDVAEPARESDMPTEEELAMVAKLREVFVEVFQQRKTSGTEYLCVFGDLNLTRIVRGMGGQWPKVCDWFMSMLLAMREINVDAVIQSNIEKYAEVEKEGRRCHCKDFPNYDVVVEHHKSIFTLDRMSPSGDLINYIPQHPYGCQNSRAIMDNMYDKYLEYYRHANLMFLTELDNVSRAQNRMVKKASVVDFKGCRGFGDISYKPYDDAMAKDIHEYSFRLMCEASSYIVLVNVPWYLAKLINLAVGAARRTGAVPERTLNRLFVASDNGTSDPRIVEFVGAEQLMALYAWRTEVAPIPKEVLEDDENLTGEAKINGGGVFERVLGMPVGKKVSWKFEVQAGNKIFGSNVDLSFSVEQIVDPPEGAQDAELETVEVVSPKLIKTEDGEISGDFTSEKAGMLRIMWSNAHSWIRPKSIKFEIDAS